MVPGSLCPIFSEMVSDQAHFCRFYYMSLSSMKMFLIMFDLRDCSIVFGPGLLSCARNCRLSHYLSAQALTDRTFTHTDTFPRYATRLFIRLVDPRAAEITYRHWGHQHNDGVCFRARGMGCVNIVRFCSELSSSYGPRTVNPLKIRKCM